MRFSHLDGVRGWASLMVLFSHLGPCFLLADLDLSFYPLITDGALAVYLFFVLSGLVMSIHHFRSPSRERLLTAALRRYPRLCLPVLAASLLAVILVQSGAMWNGPLAAEGDYEWLAQFYRYTPDAKDWLKFSVYEVFFRYDRDTALIPVLWTMQHELAGSMAIFLFLALFGQHWIRFPLYVIGASWLITTESPLLAFLSGMVLADLITSRAGQRLASQPFTPLASLLVLTGCAAAAMFRAPYATPLHLTSLATGLLLAVSYSAPLRRLFETPLSRRLGELSFSLYLVHFLLLCSVVSALHLGLLRAGVNDVAAGILTFTVGTVTSLAAAWAFKPVETSSMQLARRIGDTLLAAIKEAGPAWRRAPQR